jgi:hypothetical protein
MLVALQLLSERKVLIKFSQAGFGTTRGPLPRPLPPNPAKLAARVCSVLKNKDVFLVAW